MKPTTPTKRAAVLESDHEASSKATATGPNTGHSEEKYYRILQSAIAVFAEHGYFSSRISDIAKKAKVADGTIYLYFKNKEQILMAALDFAFDTFMQTARTELSGISDPREKLRRLAFLHLDRLGANRGLAMVVQTELRQSAKFLSAFSHRHMVAYFDLIRGILREGQAAGQFRSEINDRIAANCFFGSLDSLVTSWLLSEHEYQLSASTDGVMEVILAGLEKRR
ncbi:MAG TPA: TetR/AcrR family transcriptional regulator [Terriglobales bacterium]|nr:TetR/AcrR family transcriptional regulator [Terriglobales bacterium]